MSDTPSRYALVRQLRSLPDEWLMHLLWQVFEQRRPPGGEDDRSGGRYFAGVSSRDRDPGSGRWSGQVDHLAVARPDPRHYDDPLDGDGSLVQSGACRRCQARLAGSHKHVICPICDEPGYLT
ncbi:hypothetical protein Sru01_23470 [Sphaerisporangium rufum]|uniref:Uncharacterized protein n=1 Tax=Sphaerisporangium rufum TaxID=1381558 RepID=A0A919R2V8_9ACTN|nr:hypothetical protein [Sphaerisporangium rufum]GII77365.1 hypothetical protein Sru01_23470 [Sphaerisporangium rufum]